jgi:hypothetical protein
VGAYDQILGRVTDRFMADLLGVSVEQYERRRARNSPGQLSLWDDPATESNLLRTSARQKSLWDEDAHPRHPAGTGEGGQFAPREGSGAGGAVSVAESEKREDKEKQPEEKNPEEKEPEEKAEPAEEKKGEELPAIAPGELPTYDENKTPRENAEAYQRKLDEDYEFARKSAISNAGEDLKGSARHIRNQWRTLEDAERDGMAEQLVTRDQLLKNEPHNLSNHADKNPIGVIMLNEILRAFPPKPGYKARTLTEQEAKQNRSEYLDAYRTVKAEAEKIAASGEDDPVRISFLMSQTVSGEIDRLRTQFGRWNDTANGLVNYSNSLRMTYKRNSLSSKVKEFISQSGISKTDVPEGTAADVAMQIIEGKTFSQVLGRKGEKREKKFDPAELYVGKAERSGGPELPAKTAKESLNYLIDKAGLRGVQFGNSVTDAEREHHAKMAAGAMLDLASVMGFPVDAVGLGGKLGLAMGARGKGNALAHYEPSTKVINLTRKSGVGSLAHEWGHAFDNEMGRGEPGSRQAFLSERSIQGSPLSDAMQGLEAAWVSSGYRTRLFDELQLMVNKKQISVDKANKYWNTSQEIFARTFERHIQAKLENSGRKNTYLAGISTKAYKSGGLWPTDAEVEKISPAFDKLFEAYRKHRLKLDEPVKYSLADAEAFIDRYMAQALGITVEQYAQRRLKSSPGQMEFQWITVHPNGPGTVGHPVMISKKDGTIAAGMGGKFNGQKIGEIGRGKGEPGQEPREVKRPEPATQRTNSPWKSGGDEMKWHGSRVRVEPAKKWEDAYEGTVQRVLNNGEIVEVKPDGQDGTFRVDASRAKLTEAAAEPKSESLSEAVSRQTQSGKNQFNSIVHGAADFFNSKGVQITPQELNSSFSNQMLDAMHAPSEDSLRQSLEKHINPNSRREVNWWLNQNPSYGKSSKDLANDWEQRKKYQNEESDNANLMEKRAEMLSVVGGNPEIISHLKSSAKSIRGAIALQNAQYESSIKRAKESEAKEAESQKAASMFTEEHAEGGKPLSAANMASEMNSSLRYNHFKTLEKYGLFTNGRFITKLSEKTKKQALEKRKLGSEGNELAKKTIDEILGKKFHREEAKIVGGREFSESLKGEKQLLIGDSKKNKGIFDSRMVETVLKENPGATMHVGKDADHLIFRDKSGETVGVVVGFSGINFDRKHADEVIEKAFKSPTESSPAKSPTKGGLTSQQQSTISGMSKLFGFDFESKEPRSIKRNAIAIKKPSNSREEVMFRQLESHGLTTGKFRIEPNGVSELAIILNDKEKPKSSQYSAADSLVDRFMADLLGLSVEQYAARKLKSSPGQQMFDWITVHPNGAGTKGVPVMIDKKDGTIKAGMGGKFDGMKIGEIGKGGGAKPAEKAAEGKPAESGKPAAEAEKPASGRFIVVSKRQGRFEAEDHTDDIADFKSKRPMGFYKYYDTQTGEWVQPGKRGPVKDKNNRPQYQEVPTSIENILDGSHEQTIAERKGQFAESGDEFSDFDKSQHRKQVRMAMAMGKPVRPEVLADYPDIAPKTSVAKTETQTTPEAADLQARDRFTDSTGQEYEVFKSRFGTVVAHPVINGKPQVNRDSGVTFAINDTAKAKNPDHRTDIKSVSKWQNPDAPGSGAGSGIPEPKSQQDYESIPRFSVYRSGGKFMVKLSENERPFGDEIHPTESEAIKSAEISQRNDLSRKRIAAEQEKKESDAAIKKKSEIDSYKGFLADNPMKFGKSKLALDKLVRSNGKITSKREWVERLHEEGYTPGDDLEFVDPKDNTLSLRATKTEMDYFNHLKSIKKPAPAPAHPFAQSAMKGKIREASGQKMPGEESSSSWYETGKINNYSDDDIRKFYLGRALQTAGKLTAKDFEKGFDSAINSAVSRGDVTDKIANAASVAFDRGKQQAGSKPSPAPNPSTFTPEMVPGQQASLFGGDDMNTGQKSLFNMVRPTKADQRAARKGEAPSASLLEQIDEEEKKRAESRKSLPGQRDMFSADQIDRFLEQYRAGSGTAKKEKKPKTVTGTYGDRGRFITVGEGDEARPVFLPGSVKRIKETGEYRTDNSQEKAKAARKKAKATGGKKFVPVTKLEKAIVEKIGDHPTDVREFRKIVDRTFSEMNSDAQDRLSAIREIMAFAGYGRNAGAFINQVKAARDYDKISRFDQMAQFAQREYPHILAPKMKGAGGDVEGALFALLRDGIPEKLAKDSPEVIDAAWDRSDYERMGTPSEWEEEREERQQDDDFVPFSAGRFAITERYSARVSSPGGSFRPRLTQAIR